MSQRAQAYLDDWNARLEAAEQMIPLVGALWRRQIPTYVHGEPLYLKTAIGLIKAHRAARLLAEQELSTERTLAYVRALSDLDLGPARVDIGRLVARHEEVGGDLAAFVAQELSGLTGAPMREEPQDVVLYGFGRIGRLLARLLIERMGGGEKFRLRGIVVRGGRPGDLVKRASLLRRDSIHGPFDGTIQLDEEENALVANGNLIHLLHSDAPDQIDYAAHGIRSPIVLDNTGKWRDREGLERHLAGTGASKVVLTAPGKGDVPNLVFGVNHREALESGDDVLSAASCTTNAIVPVLKAVHDRFGIESGHVESCHAFTNDQNLIDNYHPKARRGRAAPLNMVLTETGAAKAVAKALPELEGRLTGNAIRVPTPNVSMAILNLTLEREASREELNAYLRECSLRGPLRYQIGYTASPDVVSSDLVGHRAAGIVDAEATLAQGHRCVLYVWYDNEYGYACQVVRLLEALAGIRPAAYPAEG